MDGPDGAGKSTVCDLLRDYLEIDLGRKDVHRVTMPGATEIGKEFRRIVKDPKFSPSPRVERLIFSADSLQFEHEYSAVNQNGGIIICDRFSRITDLCYGAASGLDLEFMTNLQDLVGQVMVADYFFVFQCPAEVSLQRKEARLSSVKKVSFGSTDKEVCRIELKGREHAERISKQYNSLRDYHTDLTDNIPEQELSKLQRMVQSRAKHVITVDATLTSREILTNIISSIPEIVSHAK